MQTVYCNNDKQFRSQSNFRLVNHCVKSVQIRRFFWSVFSCIQSEYRKIQTRKLLYFDTFHAVNGTLIIGFLKLSKPPNMIGEFTSQREKTAYLIMVGHFSVIALERTGKVQPTYPMQEKAEILQEVKNHLNLNTPSRALNLGLCWAHLANLIWKLNKVI